MLMMGGGPACVEAGGIWKIYLPFNFAVNLRILKGIFFNSIKLLGHNIDSYLSPVQLL